MRAAAAVILATMLVACGGGDGEPQRPPARSTPAGPPDAGTERGHGADDPRTVPVPEADASPPSAAIEVDGRLAVATGEDVESGVARIRVSVHQHLVCRGRQGRFRRRHRSYFPPPAVERVRAARGAELPVRASRTRRLKPSAHRCGPDAELDSAVIEVWGEATNGLGLERVTDHQRVRVP